MGAKINQYMILVYLKEHRGGATKQKYMILAARLRGASDHKYMVTATHQK